MKVFEVNRKIKLNSSFRWTFRIFVVKMGIVMIGQRNEFLMNFSMVFKASLKSYHRIYTLCSVKLNKSNNRYIHTIIHVHIY